MAEFERQTLAPFETQKKVLFDILWENRDTLFGREHNFEAIRSIDDFRHNVNINSYEMLRPYIRKMVSGETNILTKDNPIFFGITSGSTKRPKFIPVTKSSRSEKQKIMRLWMYRVIKDHPNILDGKVLAIVSPAVEGYTKTKVPYGSESGDAYINSPWFIKDKFSLPAEIFSIEDYEARYYAILRVSMEQNITTISTLNPLTILVIFKKLDKYARHIMEDIRKGAISSLFHIENDIKKSIMSELAPNPGRAEFLMRLFKEKGRLYPPDFWPDLKVIECWKGGTIGLYLNDLRAFFGGQIIIRDFGYLSTEARCSLPVRDDASEGILTVGSNFYEFIPEEEIDKPKQRYLTVDQIEKGRNYYVIFTSKNGLYRYDIDDIIRVTGFHNRTPLITFIQKGKNVSSAVGEKLYENQIIHAVNKAKESSRVEVAYFSFCLDQKVPPRYALVIEFAKQPSKTAKMDFLLSCERILSEANIEYKMKRRSQRLGHPTMKILKPGSFEEFRKARLALLQHDSQFKACHLRQDLNMPPEFIIDEEINLE